MARESYIGYTKRAYFFDVTTDDWAITIPKGAHAFSVRKNENALVGHMGTTALVVDADGSSRIDESFALDADTAVEGRSFEPCRVGEILSLSNADGSTAIGEIEIHLWGEADWLPDDADDLTTSDPGA